MSKEQYIELIVGKLDNLSDGQLEYLAHLIELLFCKTAS